MLLTLTIDDLTPEAWQRVFGAYVKANRSHWTGPPPDIVRRILREKGAYEFGFTAMGTWASRFRLAVGTDGLLDAEFVINPDLPERMRDRASAMREIFLRELTPLRRAV